MRLDFQTLDGIADLICGDKGSPYRSGPQVADFFKHVVGETQVLEWLLATGSRKQRVYKTLTSMNGSQRLERVILRLADPREYAGNRQSLNKVLQRLNSLLTLEGLRVELQDLTPTFIKVSPEFPAEASIEASNLPAPPDFLAFGVDKGIAGVLRERWQEAQVCIQAGAHLAAVVLVGSILEGVLTAKITRDTAKAYRCKSAPKNEKGQTLPIENHNAWSLSVLIDVARECGWLGADIDKLGHGLRESRNLVHPFEQLQQNYQPDQDTSDLAWRVLQAALNDLARNL
jgi:hypothetical protein